MKRNVIVLPGIIAPAAIRYAPLLARLSNVEPVTKDLEVYSFDAPPQDYSIALEIAGVDRVADKAGFAGFHLYGHSAGGAIALAYTAKHPDRVLSLAVDEPAYDFTGEGRADIAEFVPLASLARDQRMRAFMKLQVSSAVTLPPPHQGPPPAWMEKRPAGINAFLSALDNHERLESQYTTVRSPVLFTWGSLTHPRWDRMRQRLERLFPDFIAYRFDGLHHLNTSHQAEPERVAGMLDELWTRAEKGRI
jgi:pimeloyl-ACP methyl ester carboxylesterase